MILGGGTSRRYGRRVTGVASATSASSITEHRISLRFEKPEIVKALLAGGYVSKNVAGVITVTEKGQDYLRKHPL